MLKISRAETTSGEAVLKLEGTLRGAWVAEFRAACEALLRVRNHVVLDLAGVTYVDRAGTKLLSTLQTDRRVVIEAASAFVIELLRGGAA